MPTRSSSGRFRRRGMPARAGAGAHAGLVPHCTRPADGLGRRPARGRARVRDADHWSGSPSAESRRWRARARPRCCCARRLVLARAAPAQAKPSWTQASRCAGEQREPGSQRIESVSLLLARAVIGGIDAAQPSGRAPRARRERCAGRSRVLKQARARTVLFATKDRPPAYHAGVEHAQLVVHAAHRARLARVDLHCG